MGQAKWIFVDDYGKKNHIGLYHGTRTGHVLIYCNTRPVVIDFNIRKSKTYSFFLNDELCEVHLKRDKDYFTYTFEINKTADTSKNRVRKREDVHLMWLSLLILIAFAALVVFLTYLLT